MKVYLRWFALLLVALVLAPFASTHPDGLERVAEQHHFIDRAQESFASPLPDYAIPGMKPTPLNTVTAGLIGMLFVGGGLLAVGKLLVSHRTVPSQRLLKKSADD